MSARLFANASRWNRYIDVLNGEMILAQALQGRAAPDWQMLPVRTGHFVRNMAMFGVAAIALVALLVALALNPSDVLAMPTGRGFSPPAGDGRHGGTDTGHPDRHRPSRRCWTRAARPAPPCRYGAASGAAALKAVRGTLLPPATETGKAAFLPLPEGRGSSAGRFDNVVTPGSSIDSDSVLHFWRTVDFIVGAVLVFACLGATLLAVRDFNSRHAQLLVLMPDGFVIQTGADAGTVRAVGYAAIGGISISVNRGE